ncbi:MAG: ABC transporter substrate-binding protein [Candidatus Hodarchaeales archaeon]|jgi:ABC-type transport system substrate-binding protein
MRLKSKITLYAFLTTLIFLANAASPVVASVSAVSYPDTLIIETIDKPQTNDPSSSYETFGGSLVDGMYEFLITYGHEASDLEGEVASDWAVAADGKSINFSIEPGHFFVLPQTGVSTGIEINAWHVKYSIDRTNIMADPDGYGWMLDGLITGANSAQDLNISEAQAYVAAGGVEVLDDWTVRVNLDFAYAAAVTIFAFNAGIVMNPVWIAAEAPASYTQDTGGMTAADNATGMFSFTDWFAGENVTEIMVDKLGFDAAWDPLDSGVVPSTGVNSAYRHERMTLSGCGSGPYYLLEDETTYGQAIKFAKNTLWEGFVTGQGGVDWKTAPKLWPNAPEFVLIKTVNEPNTRLLDLQAGEADLPGLPTSLADQVIDIDKFLADGTVEPIIDDIIAFQVPSLTVIFLGMNQKSVISSEWIEEAEFSVYNASDWYPYAWSEAAGDNAFSDNRTLYNNPFANYLFRQAFIKSLDAEAYLAQVLNGFGIIPEGCIPQGLMGHEPNLIEDGYQPTYDPDGAKAIFSQLGWKGSITLAFNEGNTNRRAAALLLESAIEGMSVGISISIREVSWPTYLSIYKTLPAFLIGWAPDYADPDNYVDPFYGTYFAGQLNYSNPTVIADINAAKAEPSQAVREQMYFDIERNASLDYPFVPLYQGFGLSVRRDWIQGDYASVLNPMRNGAQPWERLEKKEPPTTTVPPTSDTTPPTSDTTPTTTEEPTDDGGPGFEFAAFLIAASVMTIFYRKRRR